EWAGAGVAGVRRRGPWPPPCVLFPVEACSCGLSRRRSRFSEPSRRPERWDGRGDRGSLTGNSGDSRGQSREVACPGDKLRPPGRVSPAALPERRRDETWSARGGPARAGSPSHPELAVQRTLPSRSLLACAVTWIPSNRLSVSAVCSELPFPLLCLQCQTLTI
uniref:RIKEN cDNA A930002H24 gene n=1 Tax=Mus spicilegus TaxID=10103 RepID=A0A8C6H2Q5_MUSSI